ncbi:hypothetical protein GM418_05830 [Maribellus comscasis]|uniref:Uncharacterized protein n=1 Tax=Maribellus comscasis TaxID=2681766 RepID=A0A6I6JK32_9BACT|nr:hypothetical protein [Maribellus comscasis]QGY43195.1 hypothetical protein GM418_05830 [Maribellus comscasis]
MGTKITFYWRRKQQYPANRILLSVNGESVSVVKIPESVFLMFLSVNSELAHLLRCKRGGGRDE